ncbi:MAG: ubiquinone biosynthesis regulatory protein kinase UbiB [Thiotrichales bacterium]|jgi:ubiquinone biosynthesis protein|nr:ubiquinone biosynthesis regulatory protein kinase UbiB [Thiotrichales bacterium]MBT3613236.1 ubiquinone biosynthesis regulatory protein kinase UbiB [Thiotrichales bacterium]MBT3752710.1 ubiquinone biosynthesis regulatory protein kinase UbiB [Thiotrichales bacterium]MBT3837031.1 ubiquinone biosynthesis regulatory protein kinase UbiB [Thiotrichales bacterium]MBT4152538.1 ubiquinone biosynthesis regulatory protein kinase UbiB [Thiotrichales bacterium]
MIKPKQIWRMLVIQRVLARHRLDEIIFTLHLFRPLRFLLYISPLYWMRRDRGITDDSIQGERIRLALEDLGPIFVKLGQMFSTRRDLLPDAIADELAKLQDSVPPFSGDRAKQIVEQALGDSVENIFSSFDIDPLASASIAQVHTATTKDGRKVVVKVVRPDIEKQIHSDLGLAKQMAALAESFWSEGRRLHLKHIVADYEQVILDELDMMREAASLSQVRRNFSDHASSDLIVPEPDWSLTRENILVMEQVHGIPVGDIAALRTANVDMQRLSELGVEIFFTQVFRDNFFHADMHPGNILVDAKDPKDPKYVAVDFGIMGSLTEDDQRYLAENFLAFFNRDYRKVAQLHLDSGWVPANSSIGELESAFRSVCEPIFERPFSEISFALLLLKLFRTGRRFGMEVQPQLVLLQKTLLYIEGLGKQLYPDLDLWATAKPFLENWIAKRKGFSGLKERFEKDAPDLITQIPEIPVMVYEILQQAQSGKLALQWKSEQLEKINRNLLSNQRTTYSAIVAGSMLVSSTLLLNFGYHTSGVVLAGIAVAILVKNWPNRRRD